MSLTRFPHGISSFGMPILGSGAEKFVTTGSVYFVHSTGSNSNSGTDPDHPLATIDYAIGKCTADKKDLILVMPGHTESVATSITADVDGISIIGLGNGDNRPTITGTAATDDVTVTGDDVLIDNLKFKHSTANCTAMVNVAGANCTIQNCHFEQGQYAVHGITVTATAAELKIINNVFEVTANGPDEAIDIEGTVARLYVGYNIFNGMTTTNSWDDGAIVSGSAHTDCLIEFNRIMYLPANKGGIEFTAAATGLIQYNIIGGGTLGEMIDPGSCLCFENREADAVDESARLFPTTTAS